MLFYPLLFGALATAFPFLAMMGMMVMSARAIVQNPSSLFREQWLFFLAPLGFLVLGGAQMMIPAIDAICGVGLVLTVFYMTVKSHLSLNTAFTFSTLTIICYGLIRILAWNSKLGPIHTQALTDAASQFQSTLNQAQLDTVIALMSAFWPASWILTQIAALFIGFVLFQRVLGIGFRWESLRFSYLYNILLLAVVPLYFFTNKNMLMLNGAVALCAIPFLQGLGLVIEYLAKIIQSKLIRAMILVVLLFNILSYPIITLFGFAGMWWNQPKFQQWRLS